MKKGKVFILTGAQGAGKTGRLIEVIDILLDAGIFVHGFYAKGYWDKNVRSRFDLVDIQSGKSALLCSDKLRKSFDLYGRFYFNPETINWGNKLLLTESGRQKILAVIDEVGRFEVNGLVWASALEKVLEKQFPVLLVIRDIFVDDVIRKFGFVPDLIFSVETDAGDISRQIRTVLNVTD